jgi:hypothetical protein
MSNAFLENEIESLYKRASAGYTLYHATKETNPFLAQKVLASSDKIAMELIDKMAEADLSGAEKTLTEEIKHSDMIKYTKKASFVGQASKLVRGAGKQISQGYAKLSPAARMALPVGAAAAVGASVPMYAAYSQASSAIKDNPFTRLGNRIADFGNRTLDQIEGSFGKKGSLGLTEKVAAAVSIYADLRAANSVTKHAKLLMSDLIFGIDRK